VAGASFPSKDHCYLFHKNGSTILERMLGFCRLNSHWLGLTTGVQDMGGKPKAKGGQKGKDKKKRKGKKKKKR
jgi:hypothetical protein